MPVQINEVIIRAVVDPKQGSLGGRNQPECPPQNGGDAEGELMEKLLNIIKEKQER